MPIGTLLLALALFVIVGIVIALPLFDRRRPAVYPPTRREALEAERRDIVRTIRELDFDHRTHKINDDDYRRLREEHVQRGAQVLRELNTLHEKDVDSLIEARVAKLRKSMPSETCPACGHAVDATARFCPQCGIAIDTISSKIKTTPIETEA
jgi:rubrerythrin